MRKFMDNIERDDWRNALIGSVVAGALPGFGLCAKQAIATAVEVNHGGDTSIDTLEFIVAGRPHRVQARGPFGVRWRPSRGMKANVPILYLPEDPKEPNYMRDRYQRMELFIVPALQWLACLLIGLTLLVDPCWGRFQRRGVGVKK